MTAPASALRFAPVLAALALIAPVGLAAPASAQAARDFQLPPGPTQTPDNQVQGPVDPDAPVPARPRAIETARPTPAPPPAPTPARPAAAPTSAPRIVVPDTAPAPVRPRPATGTAPPPAATSSPAPALTPPVTGAVPASEAAPVLPAATPAPAPVQTAGASEPATVPWLWIALGALAALAAGAAVMVRRRSAAVSVPEFVPPVVPAAPAAPAAAPGDALALSVEAVRLDRSMMNATAQYRITVRNRTAQAIAGLSVEADLVSASRDRPVEAQLASSDTPLAPRHHAERIAPGQSVRFEGQVRLPLSEASAIWQGNVGLLVPLLRVRARADGAAPVAATLVIGRAEGGSARPQPFRLDEPPRSYAPLAQRTLDAGPARA